MKRLCFAIFLCSIGVVHASESTFVGSGDKPQNRLEVLASGLLSGTLAANLNFGLTDFISLGPSFGFNPVYLATPNDRVVAFMAGVNSHISLFSSRYSSSFFLNPYAFFYGFFGYRVTEPAVHFGFNLGYRWIFSNQWSLAIGAGVQSIFTSLSTYSYSPSGRRFIGSVNTFVPVAPSFVLSFGFPI